MPRSQPNEGGCRHALRAVPEFRGAACGVHARNLLEFVVHDRLERVWWGRQFAGSGNDLPVHAFGLDDVRHQAFSPRAGDVLHAFDGFKVGKVRLVHLLVKLVCLEVLVHACDCTDRR